MWDVVYAIDTSASMGKTLKSFGDRKLTRIDAVKQGLLIAVARGLFPPGTRISVISFHSDTKAMGLLLTKNRTMVQVVVPLTRIERLTSKGSRWAELLNTLKVSGATPAGFAIQTALEILNPDRPSEIKRIKKIILITDEKSNVGPEPHQVLGGRVLRNIILQVVGIGEKVSRAQYEDLAHWTGGWFFRVKSRQELVSALQPRIPLPPRTRRDWLLAKAEETVRVLRRAPYRNVSSVELQALRESAADLRSSLIRRAMKIAMEQKAQSKEAAALAALYSTRMLTMVEYAKRVWPAQVEVLKQKNLESEMKLAIGNLASQVSTLP